MTSDDEMREQLRRADPAASLRPLPAEQLSALVHRVTQDEPAPRRYRWAGPIAALATVAAAAVGVVAVGLNDGSTGSEAPLIERVRVEDSGQLSKCVPPSAAELRTVDVAVQATVSGIEDGVVTLAISQVWAGPEVDVLEVQQTSGASEVLMGGTAFQVGQSYLIAAEGGTVWGCGYSGVSSPELRALFDEAF